RKQPGMRPAGGARRYLAGPADVPEGEERQGGQQRGPEVPEEGGWEEAAEPVHVGGAVGRLPQEEEQLLHTHHGPCQEDQAQNPGGMVGARGRPGGRVGGAAGGRHAGEGGPPAEGPPRPYKSGVAPLMIPRHGSPENTLSLRMMTVCLAAMLPLQLAAQDSLPPAAPRDSAFGPIATVPESLPPRIIEKIRIIQSDVFDSAEAKNVLTRLANSLHVMTRPG